ncbi:peptidoglycan bridge formation glycyltransferase FemA/FemB family protein [Candidatus Gottesmanbacteria bacterium]|nr:peptidoglycan bridge formation glycyltransferase FemA/FemB family protein [Candidatus Gottesmanbacteria bacterium]
MSLRMDIVESPAIWEWFVLQHSPQALFQSWMWGEVQKKSKAQVYRFGFYLGDKLTGVAQAVLVKARRGSFLHVRHGPILEQGNIAAWKQVVALLTGEAKKLGCLFVRISPLLPATDETNTLFRSIRAIPAAIHRMDGEYCWVLDLDKTEDELLSGMRKTIRYEIRKGQKDGVEVFSTTDQKYLKDFFTLYEKTSTRQGFVPHTGIREEFEVFAKAKQAMLYIGKFEKQTTAAAIILYYGNQAIYHHGASVQSKVPASPVVQWEAMLDAKKRGMKVYNFWGIAPENSPNHPWRGITLFKKGFGGREITYSHAQDIPVSIFYLIPRAIETVRRLMKGYD